VSTRVEAANERLRAVLDAPLAPTRDPLVAALAARRASEGPPADITIKAAVAEVAETPADEDTGEVIALVSDYGIDRDGERFAVGSWSNAISKIRAAGRPLPLLFGHDSHNPSTVVGMAGPNDLWADERGLWLRGWLDTTDSLGQRIYRMVKRGVLSWSVGFRPGRSHREGGGKVFDEVDELLEVSLTPIPANARTFTASAKAADRDAPTLDQLHHRMHALGLAETAELQKIRDDTRAEMLALLGTAPNRRLSLTALRKRSTDLALEVLTDGIDLPDESRDRVPTAAELRERAIELGVPAPPSTYYERVLNQTRTEFMHLLNDAS
jgi:HK97 family phage prohead protease